jgi:hypothetical protein
MAGGRSGSRVALDGIADGHQSTRAWMPRSGLADLESAADLGSQGRLPARELTYDR